MKRLAPLLALDGCLLSSLGALLAHGRVVPPITGFTVFLAGVAVGFATALLLAVVAVRAKDRRLGAFALLAALPVLLAGAQLARSGGEPALHDVSTDLVDPPPLSDGRPFPGETSAILRKAYPDLAPLELALPPEAALQQVLVLARERGWEPPAEASRPELVFQVAESRLFHFRDDITVRIRPSDHGSRVDVRSASRDGKGDLGVNAARIRAFLQDLQAPARP